MYVYIFFYYIFVKKCVIYVTGKIEKQYIWYDLQVNNYVYIIILGETTFLHL